MCVKVNDFTNTKKRTDIYPRMRERDRMEKNLLLYVSKRKKKIYENVFKRRKRCVSKSNNLCERKRYKKSVSVCFV